MQSEPLALFIRDLAGISRSKLVSMQHYLEVLPCSVLRQQWISLLVPWIGNFFERPRNLALLNRLRIYIDYIFMRTGLHTGSLHFGHLLSLCAFTTAFANLSHDFTQEALEAFAITFDWARPSLLHVERAQGRFAARGLMAAVSYGSRFLMAAVSDAAFRNCALHQHFHEQAKTVLVQLTNAFPEILCSLPLRTLRFCSAVSFQRLPLRPLDLTQSRQWTLSLNTRCLKTGRVPAFFNSCFTCTP